MKVIEIKVVPCVYQNNSVALAPLVEVLIIVFTQGQSSAKIQRKGTHDLRNIETTMALLS